MMNFKPLIREIRANAHNSARESRHRERNGGHSSRGYRGAKEDYLVTILLGAIVLLLTVEVHAVEQYRFYFVYAGTIVLMLLTGVSTGFAENMGKAILRGPNVFITGLLLWTGYVAIAVSPDRAYATTEMLRLFDGVVAFLITAYMLRTARQPFYVALGFAGIAIVLAISSLFDSGRTGNVITSPTTGFFATHEEIGSVVMMPLMIAFAIAISQRVQDTWRTAAAGVSALLGIALVMSECRSAWIGGTVGVFACAGLVYLAATRSHRKRREADRPAPSNPVLAAFESPAAMLMIGLAVFIIMTSGYLLIGKRASTIASAASGDRSSNGVAFRLIRWAAATRMLTERPVSGWGVGEYPILQGRWSHQGDDSPVALFKGTGLQNIAHNFYVQWASETGIVGVALQIAVIGSFLFAGYRGVRRLKNHPSEQALLIGCMSAVVAASIDAIGSPSYNYHGISTIVWTIMGIGVAAMRVSDRSPNDRSSNSDRPSSSDRSSNEVSTSALPPTPIVDQLCSAAIGVAIGFALLGIGRYQIYEGHSVPRGTFHLTPMLPPGQPIAPNASDMFTASYQDAEGKDVATYPGTIWSIDAEDGSMTTTEADLLKIKPKKVTVEDGDYLHYFRAALRFDVPATLKPIKVTATYYDKYNRRYTDTATISVHLGSKPVADPTGIQHTSPPAK